jgi:integrase
MKQRFTLLRRGKHLVGDKSIFYIRDHQTGRHTSLGTSEPEEAERLLHAHREANQDHGVIGREIAEIYLKASDPSLTTRTWQMVFGTIIAEKSGSTQARWETAAKDEAFELIRSKPLVKTTPEDFMKVLKTGTVATNVYLRRAHNYALDMDWIIRPVLVKKRWPKPVYKDKRAITEEEHMRVIARELNPERRAYYQILWYTGASQTDAANLTAENIDWKKKELTYRRRKLAGKGRMPPTLSISPEFEGVLRTLPASGHLFPYLRTVRECDRATEFKQRCAGLGIDGVTLHSYRYSWAERANKAGYPERFAQAALGHNSKAVARHYARNAQVVLSALETFSVQAGKVVKVAFKQEAPEASAQAAG